jgi:hypothetical protein
MLGEILQFANAKDIDNVLSRYENINTATDALVQESIIPINMEKPGNTFQITLCLK